MDITGTTTIIAEAGVNHNADPALALDLVDAASATGADIIKFQAFSSAEVVSARAPKARYQVKQTCAVESQLEMLQRLELPIDAFGTIIERCIAQNIGFLSTAGDPASATALVETFGQDTIKIGSGDLTNAPLLHHVSSLGAKMIISTGMATLGEIEKALMVCAAGYAEPDADHVAFSSIKDLFISETAQSALKHNVSLLHCTTEYPSDPHTANLRAMATMQSAFDLPVGYSDHTEGIAVSLGAVALGATIIEKHFTLDRSMLGPDHAASLEPDQFRDMVDGIRLIEVAMGDGRKLPSATELGNRRIVRKSIVARKKISKGQQLHADDLAIKRPEDGQSPFQWWDTIGTTAVRDYDADDAI